MPNYINTSGLTFNGSISTATQYSASTSTLTPGQPSAFYLPVAVSGPGHLGITLQFNPDPFSESDFGWQDYATTDTTILDTLTMTTLPQQAAEIASNVRRGGILEVAGTYNLFVPFTPFRYAYRLKFELDATFQATVSKISFSSGQ